MLTDFLYRLRALVRHRTVEHELDNELRNHVEYETQKYLDAGLPAPEAARRARLAIGGLDGIKEQCRDARGTRPFEDLVADLRYGLRQLARAPGFAVAAIAMLGLGVGSATAIFGIVESVLLRPLPYPDSQRIVTLSEVDKAGRPIGVSLPGYRDWAAGAKSFAAITALRGNSTTIVTARQSQRGYAVQFHGDVLRVFGIPVAHGRPFSAEEVQAGIPVAVVPHGFAKAVWGEAARGVGEAIAVAGVGLTIVGVLEPASDERTDVFAPAAAFGQDTSTRGDYNWGVRARLRPGIGLPAARAEMQAIGRRLIAEHGTGEAGAGIAVASLLDETVRGVRPTLLALLAAGGLLILIACANVANLLLARGVERRREIAVRQALGASRGRIVRQLLVENLPLALLSAAAGLALACWSFSGLLATVPFSIPRRAEIAIAWPALVFGLLVSLAAGILFALAPALQTPAGQLTTRLSAGGRTGSSKDGALRHALVVGQFALALAVLSCAGLLTKSFVKLTEIDTGFDHSRALIAETDLPETEYPSDADLSDFWRRAMARVMAVPGVEAVGVAESAPFEGRYPNGTFEFLDEPGRQGYAWSGIATAGFFQALDIPLRHGRLFDDRDSPTAPNVAVINQLAAEKFWPGQDPVGRRVRWLGRGMDGHSGEPLVIIGVIGNLRHNSLKVEPVPEIYAHFFQRPARARDADMVIRSQNPAGLRATLRGEFKALDAVLPVRFQTLESSYTQLLAQPRFQTMLIGFFAVCALLLSAAGLYSSMAYAVSRQTREIGIRLALGGAAGEIRRQVVGAAMRIAAIGAIIGTLLGAAGARLIASQLFGVSASDPGVFVAAGLVLAGTAALAAYIPARRASRTNPIDALRCE
jgi:putative ABC transport system permease protein